MRGQILSVAKPQFESIMGRRNEFASVSFEGNEIAMYRQIVISLPPGEDHRLMGSGPRVEGRELRKFLARANTEHSLGLPDWFFGYSEQGVPDHTLKPAISMGRDDAGRLRIAGIGPAAAGLLEAKSEVLLRLFESQARGEVRVQLVTGEHALASSPLRNYYLNRLVVGKTTRYNSWWRLITEIEEEGGWSETALAYLGWFLVQGIKSQFQDLIAQGDTIEGDLAEWLEHLTRTETPDDVHDALANRLGLKVHNVGGYTGIRATGPQGKRVMLKGILFSAHADLGGLWVFGRNRIEGFGQIQPWFKRSRTQHPLELVAA
jgi:hypothetical protein